VNFTDPIFFLLFPILTGTTAILRRFRLWETEKLLLIVAGFGVLFTYGSADLLVFLCVGLGNYAVGTWLNRATGARRTMLLVLVIAADLTGLAYFKYFSFLVANVLRIPRATTPAAVVIPLGISFYTFHVISYQIDLHRRRIVHARPIDFALYLSLFPHVIAGPIVRGSQLIPQIVRPSERQALVSKGLFYFIVGLFLKRFCADHIGAVIDPFWTADGARNLSASAGWTVVWLYYCQIYADFAGYSSMAIGMAYLLGYVFPENFRAPMTASSLRDFWRRWHMTLSSWLRDYLYIPLGGSHHGLTRAVASLVITMVLGGLWHGAGWTFIVWGLIHGICLGIERFVWNPVAERRWWSAALGLVLTQACVLIAWVFFRAPAFDVAAVMLRSIAGLSGASPAFPRDLAMVAPLALPVIAHNVLTRIGDDKLLRLPWLAGALCGVLLALLVVFPSSSSLFIYYTF
jgi:D-alanyl-lipoteichoic acid acyltransferase DltB (MBOAT superfamily)